MLTVALLLLSAPQPPAAAVVSMRAQARIVRPVRVSGGVVSAPASVQIRTRAGVRLVEFQ